MVLYALLGVLVAVLVAIVVVGVVRYRATRSVGYLWLVAGLAVWPFAAMALNQLVGRALESAALGGGPPLGLRVGEVTAAWLYLREVVGYGLALVGLLLLRPWRRGPAAGRGTAAGT